MGEEGKICIQKHRNYSTFKICVEVTNYYNYLEKKCENEVFNRRCGTFRMDLKMIENAPILRLFLSDD